MEQFGPMTYRVARAMLSLERQAWADFKTIGAATGQYRERLSHHINKMLRAGLVQRRKSTTKATSYEWRLTGAGRAFALGPMPADIVWNDRPDYSHQPLAEALGMPRKAPKPTGGRVHLSVDRRS